jgi:hypothetical protein
MCDSLEETKRRPTAKDEPVMVVVRPKPAIWDGAISKRWIDRRSKGSSEGAAQTKSRRDLVWAAPSELERFCGAQ